jgi:hypothetical protein
MTMPFQHTPITSPAELSQVLALFPKCTACGSTLDVSEPIIADPGHAFRVRHRGECPA